MGIPGFFSFIRKYNNPSDTKNSIIKTKLTTILENEEDNQQQPDEPINITDIQINNHLFLDFNGAIYTALHKNDVKDIPAFINNVIGYLDILVSINKINTLYIAIDGVPPRAKIEQQRTRRFHSSDEKNTLFKINQKYGDALQNNTQPIDTNMITPGTPFMYQLSQKIKHHIDTNELYKDIKVIFSGPDVPLEAEHKILQFIKENNTKGIWGENDRIIIYGLDADLIMLSMASHVNNIYLLREKTEYGQFSFDYEGYEFLYLDIDSLKTYLIFEFEDYLGEINNEYIVRMLDDYIFLCFLIGNDFIPKIPWLNIKYGGLDKILNAYYQIYNLNGEFLVDTDKCKINHDMLFYLFEKLAETETYDMVELHKIRKRKRIHMRDINNELDRQKKLMLHFPLRHLDVEAKINPEEQNWRNRYYDTCLHMKGTQHNRYMIVERYLESLVWTFRYYFGKLDSWSWFYPYHYGPTCLDIVNYFKNINTQQANIKKGIPSQKTTITNINNIKFPKGKPVKPQELLVMVLPYASRRFMISNIQNEIINPNSPLSTYFPKRYNLSIPYHTFYWECRPVLPPINYNVIKECMKNINMTTDEKNRNKTGEIYQNY